MNAKVIQKVHKTTNSRSFVQPTQIKAKPSLDKLGAIGMKQLLPTIESIATGTPDKVVRQSDAARFVASFPALEQNRFRIDKLYSNTRIETRHLAVNLLSDKAIALSGHGITIQSRMQMYQEYAVPWLSGLPEKHSNLPLQV